MTEVSPHNNLIENPALSPTILIWRILKAVLPNGAQSQLNQKLTSRFRSRRSRWIAITSVSAKFPALASSYLRFL